MKNSGALLVVIVLSSFLMVTQVSSCTSPVVMDANKTVQALSVSEEYTLTIHVEGEGVVEAQGELFSDFGVQTNYYYGDVVMLSAFPSAGWDFEEWNGNFTNEGSYSSNSSFFVITMLGNSSITATFVESEYTLMLEVIGDGTVSKSPDKATYSYGEEVTLTAIPLNNWSFYSWEGDLAGSFTNPEVLVMDENKSVTVLFAEEADRVLSLEPDLVEGPPPDVGEELTLTLHVEDMIDLWSWVVRVEWDPDVLEFVSVVEGGFLSGVGETLFVWANNASAIEDGILQEVNCVLSSSFDGPSGSGDLATLTFRVVGYGSTQIEITGSQLVDNDGFNQFEIPHLVVGSEFVLSAPPVHGPVASFTPEDEQWYYEGDLVTLDASGSAFGYDTVPSAAVCPITSYLWEIDFGDDGTVDLTLAGETVSFVVTYLGDVGIALFVVAPDVLSPSAEGYWESDSVSHVVHVVERPYDVSVDVYTDRGGEFIGVGADAFGPQELVTFFANVTYNGVAVVGKDVAFEIRDADGVLVAVRTGRSDENGVATVSYRLPWPDVNPVDSFGVWSVVASVDISAVVVVDACEFLFDYVVEVQNIEFTDLFNSPVSTLARSQGLRVTVTLTNVRFVPVSVVLCVSVYDECEVPVMFSKVCVSVPSECVFSTTMDVSIPSWAFVGQATAFVSVHTALPSLGGVPYSPQTQKSFMISD